MIDENLPTFYLRSSSDNIKHNASILLSSQGSDAAPVYSLRHPDPSLPASKNRYAVALSDSYYPDILFGEVLLIPEWTQPTFSKEEIRLNGGITPPPQPILPTEFVIQLYNPDQQVTVRWHAGSWSSTPNWGFEMPQQSFRQPSKSTIDRIQDDPTASDLTPKVGFKWKKEGKLSKDYVCTLSGKSTNPDGSKRKNREPDITIAFFRQFKELTLYEPNLTRVDMEDPKGLEVVLLLAAIVIREVYNSNIHEAFNITEPPKISPPTTTTTTTPPTIPTTSHPPTLLTPSLPHRPRTPSSSASTTTTTTNPASKTNHPPTSTSTPAPHHTTNRPPPPTDPRTQWELDREAHHLLKQQQAEERSRLRADAAETKRVKKMLEDEARAVAKERQRAIDRETERLKRVYAQEEKLSLQQLQQQGRRRGSGGGGGHRPSHSHSQSQPFVPGPPPPQVVGFGYVPGQGQGLPATAQPVPVPRPHSAAPGPAMGSGSGSGSGGGPYFANNLRPQPPLPPQQQQQQGYLQPGVGGSGSGAGDGGSGGSGNGGVRPKRSFWGLRGGSGGEGGNGVEGRRLSKQRSTVF